MDYILLDPTAPNDPIFIQRNTPFVLLGAKKFVKEFNDRKPNSHMELTSDMQVRGRLSFKCYPIFIYIKYNIYIYIEYIYAYMLYLYAFRVFVTVTE